MTFMNHGEATVFIGPEPEHGGHDNYKGVVHADACGVHVPIGAEFNSFDGGYPGDPGHVQFALERGSLIPWHRIHEVCWK